MPATRFRGRSLSHSGGQSRSRKPTYTVGPGPARARSRSGSKLNNSGYADNSPDKKPSGSTNRTGRPANRAMWIGRTPARFSMVRPCATASTSRAGSPWTSRGRGDDRGAPQYLRHLPGQFVGPAQVAGEEADGELPGLIHHHHRRVGILALEIRGDAPHHDPRGHDAHQVVAPCKSLPEGLGQPGKSQVPRLSGQGLRQPALRPGQPPGQPPGQGRALGVRARILMGRVGESIESPIFSNSRGQEP